MPADVRAEAAPTPTGGVPRRIVRPPLAREIFLSSSYLHRPIVVGLGFSPCFFTSATVSHSVRGTAVLPDLLFGR